MGCLWRHRGCFRHCFIGGIPQRSSTGQPTQTALTLVPTASWGRPSSRAHAVAGFGEACRPVDCGGGAAYARPAALHSGIARRVLGAFSGALTPTFGFGGLAGSGKTGALSWPHAVRHNTMQTNNDVFILPPEIASNVPPAGGPIPAKPPLCAIPHGASRGKYVSSIPPSAARMYLLRRVGRRKASRAVDRHGIEPACERAPAPVRKSKANGGMKMWCGFSRGPEA